MRTREELENEYVKGVTDWSLGDKRRVAVLLEAILDVRDLLAKKDSLPT